MIRLRASASIACASLACAFAPCSGLFAQEDPAPIAGERRLPFGREPSDPTRESDASNEAAKPRLLFATDDVFVHFVPPEPTATMRRWDIEPYGDLLVTQRDDGSMVRLLSSRLEALPTRRQKFVETRIAAVGVEKDRLVAIVWTTMTYDRPLSYDPDGRSQGRDAAEAPAPRLVGVYVYSLAEGKFVANVNVEKEDYLDLIDLPLARSDLLPATLSEEQSATLFDLFDRKRLGTESQP